MQTIAEQNAAAAVSAAPLAQLLLAVLAPAVGGVLTTLIPRRHTALRVCAALAGMLVAFVALHGLKGIDVAPGAASWAFVPSLNLHLSFHPDGLGVFFGLLVSGVGALIVLYARGYFGGKDYDALGRFYPTLGLFATAMLGVVLCDNMIAMLLFWELTSVSSFLLIGWNRGNKQAVRLALQALMVTGTGGLALLGGILLLGTATGQWGFAGAIETMVSGTMAEGKDGLLPWAFVLLFLGGATKSAQWPFHFWLPGAMAAPTPVSAYLHSATMVKAGVYLFARMSPALAAVEGAGAVLTAAGAVTMLLGAYLALRSDELKKIFAYTTVSQLGLLTCMYGMRFFGPAGDNASSLIWPVTQIFNHALYKAPLFIIAGAIALKVGKKHLRELAGLGRTHKRLAIVCLLALYAMAGGPFTLSFSMKEAFLAQTANAAKANPGIWMVAMMAVGTAACNVAIFVRFVQTFTKRTPANTAEDTPVRENGFWAACVWWPAAFLVFWQYAAGIGGSLGWHGFEKTMLGFEEGLTGKWGDHLHSTVAAMLHPNIALGMSLLAITLGVVLGMGRLWRTPITDPHNRLFPAAIRGLEHGGWGALRGIQNGSFRHYAFFSLLAFLGATTLAVVYGGGMLAMPEGYGLGMLTEAPSGYVMAAVAATVMVCVTTISLAVLRSRIVRVLALGACGFGVTVFYLLHRAPDLALTQLMFELISIILFLLALRMLPERSAEEAPGNDGRWRVACGVGVGLVMGWLTLHIGSEVDANKPGGGALGAWFTANAYEGFGAKNVVNGILVDGRGYDTLGEITVLAVACIGVFTMINAKARRRPEVKTALGDASNVDPEQSRGAAPLTTALFAESMRVVLPLSLLFAAHLFFKGHNEPGGGFIAGLVAAVSFVVYRMAKGPGALRKLLPVRPASMAMYGLAFALATGIGSMVVGQPLLKSANGYLALPGGGSFHWASVMAFDLGVFIVVVAVSVGMINRLTEELE